MPEPPEAIEAYFRDLMLTVPGIVAALDYEPGQEGLPKLPAVTMLWARFSPEDVETGSQDVTWEWDVFLYVPLGPQSYKQAQLQLKQLVPQMIALVRDDYRLGDTCENADLRDSGERPDLRHEESRAVKQLRLSATTIETVA